MTPTTPAPRPPAAPLRLAASLLLLCAASPAPAAPPELGALLGNWICPDHAVVRVYTCDTSLCVRVLRLPPSTPETTDGANPNQALRSRSLCGLVVGNGFHPASATVAEDGTLYDPKTGKTYRGSMTAAGSQLSLRGYIGLKVFGRTETWTRADQPVADCSTAK